MNILSSIPKKFHRTYFFLRRIKLHSRVVFFIIGFLSLVWFLIRVIPKPQRATYPCMVAASPWASAFVVYLLSITTAAFSFQRIAAALKTKRYMALATFAVLAIVSMFMATTNQQPVFSSTFETVAIDDPNNPMGTAKGIYPGRVVWVMDTDATNVDCTNEWGDGYFLDKNTDQDVVDDMLEQAVISLTGETGITEAWDAIFKFHNAERGKGETGYVEGEVIFIKTNATSSWSGNYNTHDLSRVNNSNYAIAETSPQLIMSVIRHLVYDVGVNQEDIYLGDPMKHIYKDIYDKLYVEFPDIHYLDNNTDNLGREIVVSSNTAMIDYSDRGAVLRTATWNDASAGDPIETDNLYTIFEEMEYMINIPTLKSHERGGVTMVAKNHFGSHTRVDAKHLHGGLTRINSNPDDNRDEYGMYRVLTDIMGHELLGKKNLVYLMDALYCSHMEVTQPNKWQKPPWNNNWTSSILISQDPVAIESVGFDMLFYEYDGSNELPAYPHYGAVDDYLHQAADKSEWPEGVTYDPENDGTAITSLGVHEHWNNDTDMEYSRNLGTGEGIELVKHMDSGDNDDNQEPVSIARSKSTNTINIYPNPATSYIQINLNDKLVGSFTVRIMNSSGREVYRKQYSNKPGETHQTVNIGHLNPGIYFVTIDEINERAVKLIKK